jgi:hypothetical protein
LHTYNCIYQAVRCLSPSLLSAGISSRGAQSSLTDDAWHGYLHAIEDMERRILALDPNLAELDDMTSPTPQDTADQGAERSKGMPEQADIGVHASDAQHADKHHDCAQPAGSDGPGTEPGYRSGNALEGRRPSHGVSPPRMQPVGDDRMLSLQAVGGRHVQLRQGGPDCAAHDPQCGCDSDLQVMQLNLV